MTFVEQARSLVRPFGPLLEKGKTTITSRCCCVILGQSKREGEKKYSTKIIVINVRVCMNALLVSIFFFLSYCCPLGSHVSE